ncbi:MAG: DUF2461 domain-containing protein [Saprospiraceae bacterium]
MSKRKVYTFLKDLTQNNSKEWMDANRKRYHEAKDIWLSDIELFLKRMAKHNPKLENIKPKQTIFRINNNRRFHPNRPMYKDNFGFSPFTPDEPSFYLQISPNNSFLGGGLWRPDNEMLKKIRDGIDYDGEELLEILKQKPFANFYGNLDPDPNALKTAPRGFDVSHKHIEFLRRKNFVATKQLTYKEITADNLVDTVEKAFVALIPLNQYLNKLISFSE